MRPERSMTIMVANNRDSAWQSGIIEQLEKFMSNPQIRDKESVKRLANFKKPVKIIFGDDDSYLNRGVAKEFHALFPNSTLKLIENSGHYVQIDKPKEVAEVILK